MRAGVGKKAELGSPAMSQHVCARRILLEQQENERHNEQDGDGQHAERGVAGQGGGGGHQEGADDRGGLREETIVRSGNP